MKGGTSLIARLSFRSKLLLVLFVPFLALVVVAAAGLSDRFTALHAQEQYGDLSGPLHSLDDASRALQNESVVSSWYVAGTTAPPSDRARRPLGRGPTPPCACSAPTSRPSPPPGSHPPRSPRSKPPTAASTRSPRCAAQVDARSADAARTREFFLAVDGHLLDFGERAARDLASADVSASLAPRVRARAGAARARPRGERRDRRPRQRRAERLQRVGRRRRPRARTTASCSPTPRPTPSSPPTPR